MSDDDDGFFREQLREVTPLKKSAKALVAKPKKDPRQLADARSRAVADAAQSTVDASAAGDHFVSDDYVDMLKPGDILEYKNPGVQHGVYRKLRLGKYPIDGRLDLHRKTVAESRVEVFGFVREAIACDARTLLILHGKGERNIERQAVLKSYVAKWLKEMAVEVLAFHTAQQKHGGLGAVYVLLRKSDRLKAKTREQHSGRQ